jgi:hypothetical protein
MFIILLIGAVVYLWRHPLGLSANAAPDEHVVALQEQVAGLQQRLAALEQRPAPPPPPPPPDPAAVVAPLEERVTPLEQHVTGLDQRLAGLDQRLSGIEHRPTAPTPVVEKPNLQNDPAIRDLNSKLDALSKQQAQLTTSEATAAAAVTARLDAEQKNIAALSAQTSQLGALSARLESAERQVGALSAQTGQVSMLAGRLDVQEKQLGALAGQAGQLSSVAGRLDAQEKQVGALSTEAGKINGVAERAARTARIQAAIAALDNGRPLGDVPDAPAALVPFRTAAPPTEAGLRLAFPAAAAAAQASTRPDTAKLPFWEAVQTRAQELITVRRGDQVIVGDASAGVIARARHALDAGDLAGAVSVLHELSGAPASAFADWVHRAQALLDARAALANLAAHA